MSDDVRSEGLNVLGEHIISSRQRRPSLGCGHKCDASTGTETETDALVRSGLCGNSQYVICYLVTDLYLAYRLHRFDDICFGTDGFQFGKRRFLAVNIQHFALALIFGIPGSEAEEESV